MAIATLPLPPKGLPLIDPATGLMPEEWRRYFLALQNAVANNAAPVDAPYWVSTANTTLTAEENLGTLESGFLTIAVANGAASPSTTLSGATLTNLNADNLASGTVAIARGGSASGTYTPTLTLVANVAAATAHACQFSHVGSTVTVSGAVDIDPTAATTLTQLGVSLPVASTLAAAWQCAGTAVTPDVFGYSAAILGDTTHHRAEIDFTTDVDVASHTWFFAFQYQVI